MSNETPADATKAEGQTLIEPGPTPAARTNPWKISTFVVGGAGLALAVITGLAGVVIGSAADRHGDFGPPGRDGGRDGGYAAGAPGWGGNDGQSGRERFDMDGRGPGRHHRHGDVDRDGFQGFEDRGDRGGPGMMDGRGFDGMPGNGPSMPGQITPTPQAPQAAPSAAPQG